ncbi:hypothetical protein GCM10023313_17160 [Mucilaginibacter defluvii]|uniref:Lysozyme n=1 Tax=Mucilaginibacter defluvii TaxID=1196019 RepID=A0ABP9FSM8_9SPHI
MLEIEQFSAKAYSDGEVKGVKKFSIGYGHQIRPNEQYLLTATINKAKGMELFASDLAPLETQVNKGSKHALNQSQYDVFVKFGYNAGTGSLAKVLTTWNTTHDVNKVAEHIKLYKYTTKNGVKVVSTGLVERRAAEALEFVKAYPKSSLFLAVGALLLARTFFLTFKN